MIDIIKKILHSYVETTWKTTTFFVVFLWFLSATIWVLEPVIFTLVISEVEKFYQTGVFNYERTIFLIIFWCLFIIFTIIFQYFYRYLFIYKNNMKNYIEICKKFNKKIVYMWYGEYISKKQGSLYKIYDRWTQWQEDFLYFFFWEVVKNVSSIVVIIVILLYVDIKMTFLALSMLPVMFVLSVFFINKLSFKQKKLNDKWDEMFGTIWNILTSFMLTKVLYLESVFLKDMSRHLDNLLWEQNQLWKWWSLVNVYTWFLVMVARLLVLWFWVYFVVDDSLSFASLFLVFAYIWWIYFPVSFMIDRFNNMVRNLTSVEKMYSEFSNIEREEIDIWKTLKNPSWSIVFENVFFWYTKHKKILNNIHFDIKPGEKVALVGNTGAGKSTIVNLLLRFWDIDTGSILLDGTDIKSLKKSSLRSHIWVVSQDNSLFNLSIEENLKFANPKATKKDIEKALISAEAQFVFDLKDGIKTVIGERGLKLSWGEKQRISIARLFLKNPEILVLDEATSALDNLTEKKIEKALKKLMKWKTSIIIAHRLSTIQHVDRIFVLENGKIVEQGNYAELMKLEKKFFNLANPDRLILW